MLMAARRIDQACGDAEAEAAASLGNDPPVEASSLGKGPSFAASLASAVTGEVEALQAALFAIPEEGSGPASAPRAFLDCAKRVVFNDTRDAPSGDGGGGSGGDVVGSGLGGRHVLSLEEDGIEIIE
jgi:hypothetical protein